MHPLALILLTAGIGVTAPADTSFVIGSRSIDLTGDGVQEVLELVAHGSGDPTNVALIIRSSDVVLFREKLALSGQLAGAPSHTTPEPDAERQERWESLESFYFDERKFRDPQEFIRMLQETTPAHVPAISQVILRDAGGGMSDARAVAIWEEIQQRGSPIFEFSSGGDGVTAIAWSDLERRFVRLWECC